MPEASDYYLSVTAGPSYTPSTHQQIPINTNQPVHIQSPKIDAQLKVRIRDYRGLPKDSPSSTSYFAHPDRSGALYSVEIKFKLLDPSSGNAAQDAPETDTTADPSTDNQPAPSSSLSSTSPADQQQQPPQPAPSTLSPNPTKPPSNDSAEKPCGIPAPNLLFGNDFDEPIRTNLPPGFNTALRIVRWAIDPGLDGDVYADKPYLYGPLLSSVNVLRVGDKSDRDVEGGDVSVKSKEEDQGTGGLASTHDDNGEKDDEEKNKQEKEEEEERVTPLTESTPLTLPSPSRIKHYLNTSNQQSFTWEYNKQYHVDFFNGYLDFNEFALKLPGFTLPIMRYWDGQPLRYVLKHRTGASSGRGKEGEVDEELLVVTFALIRKDEVDGKDVNEVKDGPGEDGNGGGGGGDEDDID
ncbi:MAG: hypothetical protein M1831_003598 [Alyxoria varia]|nr:MAG: hypothetical protein M1831_003598 [Alyxoria varia]